MILVFITALYFAAAIAALVGERRPLIYGSMVMTVCNDIILIPASASAPDILIFIAKSWREIVVIICIIMILSRSGRDVVRIPNDMIFVTVVIVLLTGLGIASGSSRGSIMEIFYSWRSYFLPFLVPWGLYVSRSYRDISPVSLYWLFLGLTSLMALYSIYATFTFDGNIKDIWFYQFIFDKKTDGNLRAVDVAWSLVRDGNLRASGFFISSVDYSMFSGFAAVYAFVGLLYFRPAAFKIPAAIAFFLCLVAVYVSRTRVGLLILAIAFIIGFAYQVLRFRQPMVYALALAGVVAVSIFYIATHIGSFEPSLAGRPIQHVSAVSSFRPEGWGFGPVENNGPTYKDSLYLSALGTFGVATPLFIWIFIKIQSNINNRFNELRQGQTEYVVAFASLLSLITFWYVFGFHYVIGGFSEYVVLLLTFSALQPSGAPNATRSAGGLTGRDMLRLSKRTLDR
ncbi:hypothetical protein [Sphingobium aquiterrae]|uniref:hypothetical protein n=1 Tax=Sphingobium aquiterrae TaxID=2038656 RepID=UPI0030185C74